MTGAGDRRREPREPLALKVEYADANELVCDYTENISSGGTFILTQRELALGSVVRLTLSFPGLLRPIHVTGTVRWAREGGSEEPGVGVAFDHADAGFGDLDALVAGLAAGDPTLVARTLRVLVVEDNPHVAGLVRDGLRGSARRELGGRVTFECVPVGNGKDALAMVRAERFDVLIVDVYLPVLDGVEVIRTVRADAGLRHLPIIAISGGGATARAAALGAGANDFLDKPMRLADLFATMRQVAGL